jgi:superfamily II DNA or RNA helicase
VAEWVKKTHEIFGKPVKTVVFCSNVAHGRDLEKGFKAAGYNFVSISYKEEDEFKREQIEEFGKPDSSIQGLIATDILTRGFDVTDVMIGVSARPFSKSFSSHVQQMGRVMRPHPGKEFAVWLDHAGNYLRFREDWDLLFTEGVTELQSGGEKAKKEPTEKVKKDSKCPRCKALWTRGSLACVECGYIRPNLSMVASVPGELKELHGANQKIALANQEFFAQVLWYARDRGYKEGWAAHKYKEKFGAFPPRQWGGLEGKAPSRETMSWIRSRVIAYAKGRARA